MNHKHGESKPTTKEYRCWYGIISRCNYKKNINYPRYGAKGIKVCERWRNNYSLFLLDMGRAPTPEHSIDRISNEGDYEPNNCRWATRLEQTHNRRPFMMCPTNDIKITHEGETLNITQWSVKLEMNYYLLHSRLKHGATLKQIIDYEKYGINFIITTKRGHKRGFFKRNKPIAA